MTNRKATPHRDTQSNATVEIDYEKWVSICPWPFEQALRLLAGIDPDLPESAWSREFRARYDALRTMAEAPGNSVLLHASLYDETHGRLVMPWQVIKWAEAAAIVVPPTLRSAVLHHFPSQFEVGALLTEIDSLRRHIETLENQLQEKGDARSPPYLDPHHSYYSAELAVAVEVWTALTTTGGLQAGRAVRKQIHEYLARHRDAKHFTQAARNRVVTVVNPRKEGGAPTTPQKT